MKILLGLALLLLPLLGFAKEELRLTPQGCVFVAQALEASAIERDAGRSLPSQKQELASVKELDPQISALVSKELDLVYGVYAKLPPDRIGYIFFYRCNAAQGSIKELMKNGQEI